MKNLKVACLFVDPKGIYSTFGAVELWGIDKDARKYTGRKPVVAHPPCNLWTSFAFVNYTRYGGAHNRPGNDRGCFASALANVRRCGGVLEHPAFSRAWGAFKLARPTKKWLKIRSNEYVCEVWQNAYGHKARKRTWLFYCGCNPPLSMRWQREPATHQIGFHDQRGKARNKPTVSGKAASATPKAFAKRLIQLARNAK